MQTKPEHITPTFAPETQFNIELVSQPSLPESIAQFEFPPRGRLIAASQKFEWRGVRFSALND
jgi:hypothetical protein